MKTDREKLIEILIEKENGLTFEQLADYLISKGVTIPVRCGECEKERECKNAQYLGETGFCSYGERKEDDR